MVSMSEREVFPNAPITEAILDIRVTPSSDKVVSALRDMHDRIKERFPTVEGLAGFEGEFLVEQGSAQTRATVHATGFLFRSSDQTRVVQATQQGFTYSKLKPYEHWERLRDEAKELWQVYCQLARPQLGSRIALRYINRIELPVPFQEFKEYILTVPEVAPGVSQSLSHFFLRLEIPYPEVPATVIVNLTIDPSGITPSVLPLIFDIDVFRETALDPSTETMWESFESLRDLKNQIFLNSLTDKAKELFR